MASVYVRYPEVKRAMPVPKGVPHSGSEDKHRKKDHLKLLAFWQSCFDKGFFLDEDAWPLQDLAPFFDSCEYQSTGAVFWPDIMGYTCSQHT